LTDGKRLFVCLKMRIGDDKDIALPTSALKRCNEGDAPVGARVRSAKLMTTQRLHSHSLVRAMLVFLMVHVSLMLVVVALVYATP
jgi:hypothetical protein